MRYRTVREALYAKHGAERVDQTVRDALIDAHMGVLYRTCFPDQWRASVKATHVTGDAMSDRQYELLNLLPRVIPAAEFYEEKEDHRPFGVPCALMGVDIEEGLYDDDLLQFNAAHLAFLNLMGGAWAYDLEDHLVNKRAFSCPFPAMKDFNAWYVDVDVFRRLCEGKCDRRWRWVADAACVAGCCTGNIFVDCTIDDYSTFDAFVVDCGWTVKGVRRLAREARAAERLLTHFSRACDWLCREPEHWPEVFKVFATSWRRRGRRGRRKPRDAATAATETRGGDDAPDPANHDP